ncbi:MAG TPA: hypothetical protein VL068_00855 [Microthrixaceae bacterium]|nr:hypothetical protein [Microthrixaceae bacterium]
MRTTVTLDPDTRILVEQLMAQRGLTFKAAVNEAIRRGLAPTPSTKYQTVVKRMGNPLVDVTKAVSLAAELEDQALAGRLTEGR